MEKQIRHRRLYAFYNSKVLNILCIIGFVALLQVRHSESMLMPLICSGTAFALFIGYSLWFWIWKPETVVINKWVSEMSSAFLLYFLIVIAIKNASIWWYIFPAVAFIIMLFIDMVKPKDEVFDI